LGPAMMINVRLRGTSGKFDISSLAAEASAAGAVVAAASPAAGVPAAGGAPQAARIAATMTMSKKRFKMRNFIAYILLVFMNQYNWVAYFK